MKSLCREMVWIPADKSLPLALCLINHPLCPTEQYVQASERGLQFIHFIQLAKNLGPNFDLFEDCEICTEWS